MTTDATDHVPSQKDHTVGGQPARHVRARRPLVAGGLVILLVITSGLAWWHWWGPGAGLPDGAAFRVGDTTVTAVQVQERVDVLQALYGVTVPDSAEDADTFRRDAAKSMAVQVLMEDAAERMNLTVTDGEVDSALEALIEQRYPDGGREAFIASLGSEGASELQVKAEVRSQLLVAAIFNRVVGEQTVTDTELRQAFDERAAGLGTPEERGLRNIVVADPGTARRVMDRIRNGELFTSVAADESLDQSTRDSGGYLGTLAAGDLERAYARRAFTTPAGELFGPVKTRFGWNVGLVLKVVPARAATLGAVRTALAQTLETEKSLAVWRTWLEQLLRRGDVEYAENFRPADPGAVPELDMEGTSGQAETDPTPTESNE